VVRLIVGDSRQGRRRASDVDVELPERKLARWGRQTLRGIQPPVVGRVIEVGGV
jgi:hypothetical protein